MIRVCIRYAELVIFQKMFKNLSVKNRIAFFYSFSFSIVLLVIFALVYYAVYLGINKTMYETLNEEIASHSDFVLHEPTFQSYVQPREWEEVEHTDIALNPVFIAIYDSHFKLVENSPNLIHNKLEWDKNQPENHPYYTSYNAIELLVSQAKLMHHGEVVGYLVVGVSTKHNQLVLDYLKTTLILIFPSTVLLVFLLARFIASKSIKPVFHVINTAQIISENNLSERIRLPKNRDELYKLSATINSLLDRLEVQIVKAKQFSADASHELKTPLSVIKGTLEILTRRERTTEQYNEKINYTLKQVDRLDNLVEQFLVLSRVENNSLQLKTVFFDMKSEVLASIERFSLFLNEKRLSVTIENLHSQYVENYQEFLAIIIDNILSNAIKYAPVDGRITLSSFVKEQNYHLVFEDNGTGMREKEMAFIQQRHFRSDDTKDKELGYGLGLHIAEKLLLYVKGKMEIESIYLSGTTVTLSVPIVLK